MRAILTILEITNIPGSVTLWEVSRIPTHLPKNSMSCPLILWLYYPTTFHSTRTADVVLVPMEIKWRLFWIILVAQTRVLKSGTGRQESEWGMTVEEGLEKCNMAGFKDGESWPRTNQEIWVASQSWKRQNRKKEKNFFFTLEHSPPSTFLARESCAGLLTYSTVR